MKLTYLISFVMIVLLFNTPITAHEGHPDNPIRTWDNSIKAGDTFKFSVDTYEENGETVTDESGVYEGATITVEILNNLTEIDLNTLEGIFLTDWSDYFQVTVDERSNEMFDTASAFLFVYPVVIDEGDGETSNVFQSAVDNDNNIILYPGISGTSKSIDGNEFTAELVNDDATFKYAYDLDTGLLNSYTEETDNHLIEISNKFSFDRLTPISLPAMIFGFVALVLITRYTRSKLIK